MEKSKKILIVEDEKPLNEALRAKLEDSGFDVAVETDGESGLKHAKNDPPDLILLDILMPEMGGLEMLTHLKHEDSLKNIPIIVLTNMENKESIADAVLEGVSDYFIKADIRLDDLIGKIKDKLETK
ncbi:response regulator [bacterium]|nr:response regulator [bacterium]|tara:strand:+ start:13307 stop:13687 length:381 start_codon:yes stop_codon:yes gene_type:complete